MQRGETGLPCRVEHPGLTHLGQRIVVFGLVFGQIARDRIDPGQLGLVDLVIIEPRLGFGLGPEPARTLDQCGAFGLERLGKEIVEQTRIGEIDRIREEIAGEAAASRFIGLLTDEARAPVAAADGVGVEGGFQLRLRDRLVLDLVQKLLCQGRVLR